MHADENALQGAEARCLHPEETIYPGIELSKSYTPPCMRCRVTTYMGSIDMLLLWNIHNKNTYRCVTNPCI